MAATYAILMDSAGNDWVLTASEVARKAELYDLQIVDARKGGPFWEYQYKTENGSKMTLLVPPTRAFIDAIGR